jgi:hypothetical protein
MRDEKLWTVSWAQPYTNWPKSKPVEPKLEPETEDLTLAREVLARIMQKRA